MNSPIDHLSDGLASALTNLVTEWARRVSAVAEAATIKAETASEKALVLHPEALIARLKLEIEKVRRDLYGSRTKRKAPRSAPV